MREVRSALGPSARLGIDANGAWTPVKAVEMLHRLEEFDLWFVEQPVPPGDVAWLDWAVALVDTSTGSEHRQL